MIGRGVSADKLKDVSVFASLSRKEQALIAKLADEVRYCAGDTMVLEDQFGNEFYIILEGSATVTRHGEPVATLGAGDYFGELAVLTPGPRNATVTAETAVRALVFPVREFTEAIDEIPTLTHKLLQGLAHRLNEADSARK